jgi:hypothetical protein
VVNVNVSTAMVSVNVSIASRDAPWCILIQHTVYQLITHKYIHCQYGHTIVHPQFNTL